MNLSFEFNEFAQAISPVYYSQGHGWKILKYLIAEALDSKGLLEEFCSVDEAQLNIFKQDEFLLMLIKQFQINTRSTELFLKFISYQYMSQKFNIFKDVTSNILDYLENRDCLELYIQVKNEQKIQNSQKYQPPKSQQYYFFQPQQIQNENIIDDLKNKNIRSNEKFNRPAQINNIQDQFYTNTQQLSDLKKYQSQVSYIQQRQNQPGSQSIVDQQRYLPQVYQDRQNDSLQQKNNSLLKQEQNRQEKFDFFQECKKQAKLVKDGISQLTQLQQKHAFLEFTFDFNIFNSNQFRCYYESKKLQIQKVYSQEFSKKKDAQHDAAKNFLPYVLFYIKFKQPYFEDDDQEMQFLQQNQQNNKIPQIKEGEQLDSIHTRINQDLLLQTEYDDEIQSVTLLVQQHEKNYLQDALKVEESQELNYFKCTVTFQKNKKIIFSEYGYGSSKKNAKQVAFMKISPLINGFYNPDILINIPKQPARQQQISHINQLHLDRFKYQVEDNQDYDY